MVPGPSRAIAIAATLGLAVATFTAAARADETTRPGQVHLATPARAAAPATRLDVVPGHVRSSTGSGPLAPSTPST